MNRKETTRVLSELLKSSRLSGMELRKRSKCKVGIREAAVPLFFVTMHPEKLPVAGSVGMHTKTGRGEIKI